MPNNVNDLNFLKIQEYWQAPNDLSLRKQVLKQLAISSGLENTIWQLTITKNPRYYFLCTKVQ